MPSSGSIATVAGLNVYLARPAAPSSGGVLLIPAATGLAPWLRRCAEDLANEGLTALAWDQFHGRDVTGLGWPELAPLLSAIDDSTALGELKSLLDSLMSEFSLTRVAVAGWCFGGRLAFVLAARDRRVAACVAYHPSIRAARGPNQTEDALSLTRGIECPVEWVHPGADQVVTGDLFPALRDGLVTRDKGATIISVYPGADHGFMERLNSDANRTAAKLAWPQTLAFLKAALTSPGT
jgi:carboxymethylenebutenolidase